MKKLFLIFAIFILFGLFSTRSIAQIPDIQQSDLTIDAATRTKVIEGLLKELNDSYVFPEIAQKMETDIRQRLQNKEYNEINRATEFAKKLTEDLQSVSHDKHLRVRYSYEKIPVRNQRDEPTNKEKTQYEHSLKINNYGFARVEILPGNIGYIDLHGFSDPELGVETVAAAMNFISNSNALIFDVRQNRGGNPVMVALICSYLFGDKPVHLNDLYFRQHNSTDEFWTKPTVLGKKYGDKDVYILTSNRTFSAAEEFTNNLRVLKRATIIGETTGGGANPGGPIRLDDHFNVFVPMGRAINPVTKTNWEGTGVEPDVKVIKEAALQTAYLIALDKSLKGENDENLKNTLKGLIEQNQKELNEIKKNVSQK